MSIYKVTQEDKLLCEKLYVEQDFNVEKCSKVFAVSQKTVYKWIKIEKWNEKKIELKTLDRLINTNLKRALNKSLISYIENPKDTDIQNLMTLLLKFTERINENKEKL